MSDIDHDPDLDELRRISLLFLLCAMCFFPLIMNPIILGFFDDTKSDAELVRYVDDHLGALRLIFTGIGITEGAIGVALWMWGRAVARRTPGRRGTITDAFSWIALAAGAGGFVGRCTSWFQDADQIGSSDVGTLDIVFFGLYGLGLSLTFIVFGYFMIRGEMPVWLGIVWVFSGVMFWLGILPLWFFFGSLVFGVRGLVKFRPGRASADQISAIRIRDEEPGLATYAR